MILFCSSCVFARSSPLSRTHSLFFVCALSLSSLLLIQERRHFCPGSYHSLLHVIGPLGQQRLHRFLHSFHEVVVYRVRRFFFYVYIQWYNVRDELYTSASNSSKGEKEPTTCGAEETICSCSTVSKSKAMWRGFSHVVDLSSVPFSNACSKVSQ